YRQIMLDIQQLNSYKAEILQLEKKKNAEQQALEIIEKKLDKGIISVLEYYTAKNNLMKTEAELLRAKTMLMVKKHTIDIYTKEQELL
ncbi:MAG TPA: TolC family protein, partial [Prolixibacteraceae bacterium]|nr:TolC family protein [Prolixibacteraceae bacterium]